MTASRQNAHSVDILIVGGGPAGLTCALHLLGAGLRVMLVDARRVIGTPVRCAELTRQDLFDWLGVPPERDWIRWRLPATWGAVVLARDSMEADLAGRLARGGVDIRVGTAVTAVGDWQDESRLVSLRTAATNDFPVRARCVVAADGVSSSVARMAGLATALKASDLGSGLGVNVRGARLTHSDSFTLRYLPGMGGSYFWTIPNGSNAANVGGILPGTLGDKVARRLARMRETDSHAEGGKDGARVVGCVPLVSPLEQPVAAGLLVVGTAARLVDPVTAEGIWHAVRSGRAAAESIIAAHGAYAAADLAGYREHLEPVYQDIAASQSRSTPTGMTAILSLLSRAGKSVDRAPRVTEQCVGCTGCVSVCLPGALRVVPYGIAVDAERCTRCGACRTVCPVAGLES